MARLLVLEKRDEGEVREVSKEQALTYLVEHRCPVYAVPDGVTEGWGKKCIPVFYARQKKRRRKYRNHPEATKFFCFLVTNHEYDTLAGFHDHEAALDLAIHYADSWTSE